MSQHPRSIRHRHAGHIWVLRSVFSHTFLRLVLGVWLRLVRALSTLPTVRRNAGDFCPDADAYAGALVILDCDSGVDSVVTPRTVADQTRAMLPQILESGDARTIVFVVGDHGLDLGRTLSVRQRPQVVLDSELPPFFFSLGLLLALVAVLWLVFEQLFDDGLISLLASAVAVLVPATAMKGLEEKIVEAQSRSRDILEIGALSALHQQLIALEADTAEVLESAGHHQSLRLENRRQALADDLVVLKNRTLSPDLEQRIVELQKRLNALY